MCINIFIILKEYNLKIYDFVKNIKNYVIITFKRKIIQLF